MNWLICVNYGGVKLRKYRTKLTYIYCELRMGKSGNKNENKSLGKGK
jgi:hypothetical protein